MPAESAGPGNRKIKINKQLVLVGINRYQKFTFMPGIPRNKNITNYIETSELIITNWKLIANFEFCFWWCFDGNHS